MCTSSYCISTPGGLQCVCLLVTIDASAFVQHSVCIHWSRGWQGRGRFGKGLGGVDTVCLCHYLSTPLVALPVHQWWLVNMSLDSITRVWYGNMSLRDEFHIQ